MAGRLRLVGVVAALLAIWAPALVRADAGMERQFTDLVHRERAAAGVPAYAEKRDLADVARGHAQRMARERRLYHNPNLGSEVQGWDALGENVGRGPSVDEIHRAFMASSSHRAEILSTTFTEVGVGVAVADDGEVWVSQVFRKPEATKPAPAPTTTAPPPSSPPPAAPTTTPPTTAPPPSTSTTVAPPPPPGPAPAATPQVLAAIATPPAAPEAAAPAPPAPATPTNTNAAASAAEQDGVQLIRAASTGAAGVGRLHERVVTMPVAIAATMLVLVVAAQTTYVASGQLSSAEARRQRSHASMNSSSSPSSTPWTLPVS